MIFKQYTLNGKRRVSNGKRHVIQRKQTRENVCGLCLNANSCTLTDNEIQAKYKNKISYHLTICFLAKKCYKVYFKL